MTQKADTHLVTLKATPLARRNRWRRLLNVLGPGLITGASDDDPSGIGTYAAAGAGFGFATLWMALFTTPLAVSVQYICAKIGMVSGTGLASVLKKNYPKIIVYPAILALIFINTLNAGVDIGAIGAAINLIVPIPITVLVIPIALAILGLQIFGSYRLITRVFKWLTLALFAYIAAAFFAKPDWGEVLRQSLIPTIRFDKDYLTTLVAILGTTISPYLFFWQATQEVEEERSSGRRRLWQRRGATDSELRYAALDVNLGIGLSNIVMFFIILTTAATLFQNGNTHISSAAEAAQALRPLAGNMAGVLLAIGLIGAGLLAVPILTGSAAYAVAELFGWRYGLNQKPWRARQFYIVITLSTIAGMLINFVGINPIDALFWTAVIGGFLSPPLLILIMLIANNRQIMGQRVNPWWLNVLGWLTVVAMSAAAVGMILTLKR